jgi:hypothetical protein
MISAASFSRPDLLVDSDWTEHAPFIFWLCETSRPRLFVELGTHRGHSFFVFCQAMQRLSPEGRCRALDLWTGDDLTGASGDTVFRAVERYSLERFAANAVLMRGRIDESLMTFPSNAVPCSSTSRRRLPTATPDQMPPSPTSSPCSSWVTKSFSYRATC